MLTSFAPFAVNHAKTVEQILRYTQNDKGLTTITIPEPRVPNLVPRVPNPESRISHFPNINN